MIVDLYQERKVEVIDIKDFVSIKDCKIENLVLFGKNQGVIKKLDVGSYCYLKKQKKDERSFVLVVPDSLSKINSQIVENYLYEKLINRNINSLIKYFYYLKIILDLYSEIHKDFTLNQREGALHFYLKLTLKLNEMLSLDKIGIGNASQIQFECAKILSQLNENLSIKYIQSICARIHNEKKNRENNFLKFSQEEQNKNFKLSEIIFNTIVDFISCKKRHPIIFDLNKIDLDNRVYFGLEKFDKLFVNLAFDDEEYSLCEYKIFKKRLNERGLDNRTKINLRKTYTDLDLKVKNFSWDRTRLTLVNIAVRAFYYMLASVSGGNTSSLLSLCIDSFTPVPSTKGRRALVSKSRANYKKVTIEFGVNFVKHYKKYIEFRKFIIKEFSDYKSEELNFFIFLRKNSLCNLNISSLYEYKGWLENNILNESNFGKINWITIKEKRLNISSFYVEKTNDVTLASIKLGNTPHEINQSYMGINLQDYQNQVANFLTRYEESAIKRSRNTERDIDININSGKFDTLSGHCINKNPKRDEAFNELSVTPNCLKSESCFFCENYSIHIDEEDLRKIYSIKFIYEYFKYKIQEDTFIQIIYRINEIERNILSQFPYSKKLVDSIKSECEQGYLDNFWDLQFNTLLALSN
jgi:hypothetical protein